MPKWTERTALDPNHKPQCEPLPSSTVLKSWSSSPQERFVVSANGKKIRALTGDEVVAVQGFDPSWLRGVVPESKRIELAGNALSPKISEVIAAAIKPSITKRNAVELFAGGGGSALGLKAAGFDVVTLVDNWPVACLALKHQFPPNRVLCSDVDDIEWSRIKGQIGLLAGGPPCQPYSSGGTRGGVLDPRDKCSSMPRIIAEIQPEAFFLENARELFSHEGGKFLPAYMKAFRGYRMAALQLQAHDYGLPQRRARAILIGLRNGSPLTVAERILAKARVAKGGVVADVLEAWEPWQYGCTRNPREVVQHGTKLVLSD